MVPLPPLTAGKFTKPLSFLFFFSTPWRLFCFLNLLGSCHNESKLVSTNKVWRKCVGSLLLDNTHLFIYLVFLCCLEFRILVEFGILRSTCLAGREAAAESEALPVPHAFALTSQAGPSLPLQQWSFILYALWNREAAAPPLTIVFTS